MSLLENQHCPSNSATQPTSKKYDKSTDLRNIAFIQRSNGKKEACIIPGKFLVEGENAGDIIKDSEMLSSRTKEIGLKLYGLINGHYKANKGYYTKIKQKATYFQLSVRSIQIAKLVDLNLIARKSKQNVINIMLQ